MRDLGSRSRKFESCRPYQNSGTVFAALEVDVNPPTRREKDSHFAPLAQLAEQRTCKIRLNGLYNVMG